jgi:hypothetical protein
VEGFKERQAARAEQRRIRNEALAAQRAEWNAALDREKTWGIENPLPPGVVLERAVERMTREGWSLQNRGLSSGHEVYVTKNRSFF